MEDDSDVEIDLSVKRIFPSDNKNPYAELKTNCEHKSRRSTIFGSICEKCRKAFDDEGNAL